VLHDELLKKISQDVLVLPSSNRIKFGLKLYMLNPNQ